MDETSKNHESLQNEADNLTFEKFENYYNNLKFIIFNLYVLKKCP